jgi:hypothetical protein
MNNGKIKLKLSNLRSEFFGLTDLKHYFPLLDQIYCIEISNFHLNAEKENFSI